jgi:serine/threonine-protein kinase
LEQFLGGGMAEVYRATDTVLERTVAYKRLSVQGTSDAAMRERFLMEARLGSQVNHDNIVRTLDYGHDAADPQGRPFIVLEFLTGQSLSTAIKNRALGGWRQKMLVARDIVRALAHIHSLKIVHRDIKPDNIHLDDNLRARLLDFGIAKTEGLNMTQAGFVLGTPSYMAPEQVRGEAVNEKTDIYAFGLVLFEMLTGRKARASQTMQTLLNEILTQPVPTAPLMESSVPEELQELVARCTVQNPAERIGSFVEIEAWIEQWLLAHPGAKPVAPPAGPKRLKWSLSVVALLLAVVAVGFGLGAWGVGLLTGKTPAEIRLDVGDLVLIPAGGGLRAFYLDRVEVTNEAYAAFTRAQGRQLPPNFAADSPGRPVSYVTHADAKQFCEWAGKRLPTEAEWVRAARGDDQRKFPWGHPAMAERANVADHPLMIQHLVASDAHRAGASPFGILQLSGNVAEWVADVRRPSDLAVQQFATRLAPAPSIDEPWSLYKGGSFKRPLKEATIDDWSPAPVRYFAEDLGFRCAKTP